jgi:hypothetical protein
MHRFAAAARQIAGKPAPTGLCAQPDFELSGFLPRSGSKLGIRAVLETPKVSNAARLAQPTILS